MTTSPPLQAAATSPTHETSSTTSSLVQAARRNNTWIRTGIGKASSLKVPSRLNMMLLCDDLKRATALARQAEAQQSALSFYWSVESLAFGGLADFDVAIVAAALWPETRRALQRLGLRAVPVVVLGAHDEELLGAEADYGAPLEALPEPAAPEVVLGVAGELAMRFYQDQLSASSEAASGALTPGGVEIFSDAVEQA